MSYFQTPPEGERARWARGRAGAGRDARCAFWAQYADEAAAWDDDLAADARGADEEADRHEAMPARPRVGARLSGFCASRVRDALAGLDLGQVSRARRPPRSRRATQAFDVLADVPAADTKLPAAPVCGRPAGLQPGRGRRARRRAGARAGRTA